MSSWKLQFDRMMRALSKIEQRNDDDDLAEVDDLCWFFQNSWNLKDWIKNDQSLPQAVRHAIVQEAELTESLQFCADLANRSKHLKLDRFERKGATLLRFCVSTRILNEGEATIWRRSVDGEVAAEDLDDEAIGKTTTHIVIASKQGTPNPSNIVGFARRVVDDWRTLLRKHKLEP